MLNVESFPLWSDFDCSLRKTTRGRQAIETDRLEIPVANKSLDKKIKWQANIGSNVTQECTCKILLGCWARHARTIYVQKTTWTEKAMHE